MLELSLDNTKVKICFTLNDFKALFKTVNFIYLLTIKWDSWKPMSAKVFDSENGAC